jgi:hypothetical protein
VLLAPLHQLLPAEARVGAQDDLDLRPGRADLAHDPLYFRFAACRRVLIRRPQPRAQQVLSREHVQRQVGGVQVQHDALGRLGSSVLNSSRFRVLLPASGS